nr:hypothetical protein [Curtobacterium sp. 'Ferrero']
MRLIFIDESARDDAFYFFGALVADAAAVRQIERGLDGVARLVAAHVAGFDPDTEFHAVDMFHGDRAWKRVPIGWRVKACTLVAKVLARSSASFIFRGVDLESHERKYGLDAYPAHLLTLAQVLESVHERLKWLDHPEQLGLVLADEHHSAAGARRSLRSFKVESAPWVHEEAPHAHRRHDLLRPVPREQDAAGCRCRDVLPQPLEDDRGEGPAVS